MAKKHTNPQDVRLRLTLRIAANSLSFSVGNPLSASQMVYEPYELNSSISMAANLRQAFNSSELLMSGYERVLVLIDSPTMLVPNDEFHEEEAETLYRHTFTSANTMSEIVVSSILAEHQAVAVFSVNKDLKLVIDDHFREVRFHPITQPVWRHMLHRSFSSHRHRLFAYFYGQKMNLFCFSQNRFKFCNTYQVSHPQDAVYFLLYAWRLLGFTGEADELHLVGESSVYSPADKDWLHEQLHQYVQRVFAVAPSVEFNRTPSTAIPDAPYDLMALYQQ